MAAAGGATPYDLKDHIDAIEKLIPKVNGNFRFTQHDTRPSMIIGTLPHNCSHPKMRAMDEEILSNCSCKAVGTRSSPCSDHHELLGKMNYNPDPSAH